MLIERTPDIVYGDLFLAVQAGHVFTDSKTFVDSIPKSDPAEILAAYQRERESEEFDLTAFIRRNFKLPTPVEAHFDTQFHAGAHRPVREHIELLWDVLQREPDVHEARSSLISLPEPYIVPGGRFREIYYWDSYFTMLGLAAAGRIKMMEYMVANFALLIDQIGFVPNGNRNYYCSRSQQPFFCLMVELLAETTGDELIYTRYLAQMEQEYAFWMDGAEGLERDHEAFRRVVRVGDSFLNRYWDDSTEPRQESYAEDVALAATTTRDSGELYRDVRAAAESGWDFSTRWFEDPQDMGTIRTTHIVPVDLNALLYKLERVLEKASGLADRQPQKAFYRGRAEIRKTLLQKLFFDRDQGFFVDLLLPDLGPSSFLSVAAAYPLFFGIATPEQAELVAEKLRSDFLKAGGWVTTHNNTGQQWDSPNGWAPMQWIVYRGLCIYGKETEAREGAQRWVDNNLDTYSKSGNLVEKYDVEHIGVQAGGGEYSVQAGFGWTNGVLVRLLDELGIQ
jgi:alpha,alpha-trehalase